jgi:hypothetical protein
MKTQSPAADGRRTLLIRTAETRSPRPRSRRDAHRGACGSIRPAPTAQLGLARAQPRSRRRPPAKGPALVDALTDCGTPDEPDQFQPALAAASPDSIAIGRPDRRRRHPMHHASRAGACRPSISITAPPAAAGAPEPAIAGAGSRVRQSVAQLSCAEAAQADQADQASGERQASQARSEPRMPAECRCAACDPHRSSAPARLSAARPPASAGAVGRAYAQGGVAPPAATA